MQLDLGPVKLEIEPDFAMTFLGLGYGLFAGELFFALVFFLTWRLQKKGAFSEFLKTLANTSVRHPTLRDIGAVFAAAPVLVIGLGLYFVYFAPKLAMTSADCPGISYPYSIDGPPWVFKANPGHLCAITATGPEDLVIIDPSEVYIVAYEKKPVTGTYSLCPRMDGAQKRNPDCSLKN